MQAATPMPRPACLACLPRFLFNMDSVGGFLFLFRV
jgi:hypothetical protein